MLFYIQGLYQFTTYVVFGALLLTISACADHSPDSGSIFSRKKSLGGDYYRVKNSIYCGKKKLLNVDIRSFRHVKWRYAKDKNFVHYCDVYGGHFFNRVPLTHVVKIFREADPATFEVLIEDGKYTGYAKDAQRMYYHNKSVVNSANGGEVKFIGGSPDFYAIDRKNVYFNGEPTKADPITFKHVGGIFFRDQKTYFTEGKAIFVNPSFAEVLGRKYIKDKLHVYFGRKFVDGADACSFVVSDEFNVAFDKNHYFNEENSYSQPREKYQIALAKWQEFYRKFKLDNSKLCPKKKIIIPRHDGEISIVDL